MNNSLIKSVIISIILVVICWVIFIVDHFIIGTLNSYGIAPRSISHLTGIIFAPILHANGPHIISNSIPLFFLTSVIIYVYKNIAFRVLFFSWTLTGLLVWLFADMFSAKHGIHIGASGLIYAEAAFLFFIGIFRRNIISLIVSLVIGIMYGGMIWGMFPQALSNISWESHLFGFLTGTYLAYVYRKNIYDQY